MIETCAKYKVRLKDYSTNQFCCAILKHNNADMLFTIYQITQSVYVQLEAGVLFRRQAHGDIVVKLDIQRENTCIFRRRIFRRRIFALQFCRSVDNSSLSFCSKISTSFRKFICYRLADLQQQ